MRSFVFISWWIDRISLLYHLFVHS
jgi:hypothetical protein